MTENEQKIINKISDLSGDYKCYDNSLSHEESLVLDKLLAEIQQYRAIGTIDEFKVLKEKNTPKKRGIWKSGHTCCPNCERRVVTEDRFCSYCGQALKPKET